VYQPQLDLAEGTVIGVEALVRWDHPDVGLIPPDEFIPIAERTELIGPLTSFVLTEAITQIAMWRRAGHDLAVSVNLSARNLADEHLVDQIVGLLDAHDVPPSSLVVELTETAVMSNTTQASHLMQQLRARGVRVSIDDFGTGQSSLAYLTTLPADELKVDRSFVRAMSVDANALTVVRAIVDLAGNLGLAIVAEGIETPEDEAALRSMGCTSGQGYFFSRPLPPEKLSAWMDKRGGLSS
jgi:EAL domain-containing protein (putative c-di-GMP-specific phosphodiesterase class I)